MKISEKEITVLLDTDGQSVMGLLSVNAQVPVYVEGPGLIERMETTLF